MTNSFGSIKILFEGCKGFEPALPPSVLNGYVIAGLLVVGPC